MNTGSNADAIYTFFHSLGFSDAGISVILGNWEVESSLNPGAYNANEGAIGLAQWEGSRRTALQEFARQRGTTETDLRTQLAFTQHELQSFGMYDVIKNATDPGSAAAYWDANYERSAGTTRQQRITDAESYYAAIRSGNVNAVQGFSASDGTGLPSYKPGMPPPPYPPNAPFIEAAFTGKGKLTADQKSRMIAWIAQVAAAIPHASPAINVPSPSDSDFHIIDCYMVADTQARAPMTDSIPGMGWMDVLNKALGWLTTAKNWERIGLFALGAIILIFAGFEYFNVKVPVIV